MVNIMTPHIDTTPPKKLYDIQKMSFLLLRYHIVKKYNNLNKKNDICLYV
jgi:hypothetical protein